MIEIIDGLALKKMFIAAAISLDAYKEEINELNVFPVPDGDTGINMTLTLSAVRKMNDEEITTLKQCAQRAQDLIMRSARGRFF